MLKENHAALRKDRPVFLYDENMQTAARLAKMLKKEGYNQLYVLKNGFVDYKGKVKTNQ
jgi:rhodanese-related sulfurtransferase